MMMMVRFVVLLLVCLEGIVESAPGRSKGKSVPSQTVYDQKQTGDYNIQLHLKDFQIIALLADDSLGGLGDYDYNYDYSEFTVKPSTSSSTSTLTPVTTPPFSIITTQKPEDPSSKPTPNNIQDILLSSQPSSSSEPTITSTSSEQSTHQEDTSTSSSSSVPGKIKVQILETPLTPSGGIGIVPGEEFSQHSDSLPSGEITQFRRCSTGFARDKKGRCRRVRRPGGAVSPQLPFGISRLASNLASRFKYSSSESSLSSASSQSAED